MIELLVSLCLTPNVQLLIAKDYLNKGYYEKSAAIVTKLSEKQVTDKITYHYCHAIINYSSLNKEVCLQHIEILNDWDFGEVPVRFRSILYLMEEDIKTWKTGDLNSVSQKMSEISRRLNRGYAGPETQAMQRKVLEDLDRLIQEKEAKASADADTLKNKEEVKENKIETPKADFDLPPGIQLGEADKKKLDLLVKNWGNLPPKEQAKGMLELTRNIHPRYKDAIETYIKEIARKSK